MKLISSESYEPPLFWLAINTIQGFRQDLSKHTLEVPGTDHNTYEKNMFS